MMPISETLKRGGPVLMRCDHCHAAMSADSRRRTTKRYCSTKCRVYAYRKLKLRFDHRALTQAFG